MADEMTCSSTVSSIVPPYSLGYGYAHVDTRKNSNGQALPGLWTDGRGSAYPYPEPYGRTRSFRWSCGKQPMKHTGVLLPGAMLSCME